MRRVNFDLDVLRTFVVGIELGSFARAADRLGRSTSAVSAQLKKLEEQAGTAVLRKSGRGMAVTEAGEVLLGYARRLLELNDEAALAVRGAEVGGWLRLGFQEDFGEHLLPDALGRFSRSHPGVRIEARVARNAQLIEQVRAGELDLALAWDAGTGPAYMEPMGNFQLQWIAAAGTDPSRWTDAGEALPLILFESPCLMRSSATDSLDRAGIRWRLVFTSPSLSGIWAAVAAGLGVTVRTAIALPAQLRTLPPEEYGLPVLPSVGLGIYRSESELSPAGRRFRDIIAQRIEQSARDAAEPHAAVLP